MRAKKTVMSKAKMAELKKAVTFIEANLPKTRKEVDVVKAFEKIDKKLGGSLLYELPVWMKQTKHPQYNRFHTFFKKYCAIIRKWVNKSDLLEKNLFEIYKNQWKNSSERLNPKYHQIYWLLPMNFDIAFEAYQYTMDKYDANKDNKWAGFWSLVVTQNGVLKAVYLGDTHDREYFYEGLKMCLKKKKYKDKIEL